jgi:hypothetical protein
MHDAVCSGGKRTMTAEQGKNWREWATDDLITSLLNLAAFVGILYVCYLAIPSSSGGETPGSFTPQVWIHASICAVILVSRMLISIVASKNRIDIVGPVLISSIFVGPLIAIAGFVLSDDPPLKELLKSIGTTMLGVGVGASANFKPRRNETDG